MNATPAVFARKFDIWMTHSVVPGECIRSAEGLFLGAEAASDLLLASIVYRVFVAGEIVRPRKHGVAWLSGAWIDPVALVRSGLAIQ